MPDKTATPKLITEVVIRLISALILISLLLFPSAGSLNFWNAWLFISALFLLEILALIYFAVKDPELLQKRLKIKEKEKTQKTFSFLYLIMFIITLIFSGLDFRYRWSAVPLWLTIAAAVIMIAAFFMILLVMKQNRYASRIIEIQNGQQVINSGLYSVIRHPLYLFATIFFCSIPLVLGSLYALILLAIPTPLVLTIRIKNEEAVLRNNLAGYQEYMKKVKYRLIPFIW
ncbi:MAG TPA: isoprenylcysteine carboxylmethyltransferase family protein [Smithellaceae bacterium]|nr:isoprenylcysteine carboxylmethyltransferase family protein [Smithellaceae bacterium]